MSHVPNAPLCAGAVTACDGGVLGNACGAGTCMAGVRPSSLLSPPPPDAGASASSVDLTTYYCSCPAGYLALDQADGSESCVQCGALLVVLQVCLLVRATD